MTDLATLGFAIDSSPAAKAASDLDLLTASAQRAEKAVDGVGAATSRVGRVNSGGVAATKQLSDAIKNFTGTNDNAVSAINRHIAAINKLTEAERRMSGATGRGADIAAYGAELDRLRAKYNPLFATINQYKGAITQIRQAHAVGAISASEMASAITRERQATLASIDAIKGRNQAVRESIAVNRAAAASSPARPGQQHSTAGMDSYNLANITAQFQDIGVTAAMGMSPLQVALQQGTQLSAVLSTMQSPIRGLFQGLMSLVSPISLITIGLIAAGVAGIQWIMKTSSAADKLDERLENHQKALEHLTKLYGDAADAADKLDSSAGKAFSRAVVGRDLSELQKQYDTEVKKARVAMRGDAGMVNSGLSFFGLGSKGGQQSYDVLLKLPQGMEAYQSAVSDFLSTVRSGTPDVDGFNKSLMEIYETQARMGDVDATSLRNMVDTLTVMAQNVTSVNKEFADFSGPINQMNLKIAEGNFNLADTVKQIEEIGKARGMEDQANKIITMLEPLVKVADAMRQVKKAADEFSRINEGRGTDRSMYEEAGKERRRINELQRAEEERTNARLQGIKAVTDAEKIAAAAAAAGAGVTNSTERKILEENAAAQERARLEQEQSQAIKERNFQRQESLIQQQEELSLIGKTAGEVAELQYQYQEMTRLREEAFRTGREMSQQEIDDIQRTAIEVGKLAEAAEKVKLNFDLNFERDQLSRSPSEQKIASRLRGTGLGMDSQEAQIMRQLDTMEKARDAANGFFDAIADAVTNGGDDIGRALVNSLVNWMASIGKQNLQTAFNNISNTISGIGTDQRSTSPSNVGALDTIGGFFKNLFGGSSSSSSVKSVESKLQYNASRLTAAPVTKVLGDVGGGISQATTVVSSSLDNLREAIAKVESSGRYGAIGPTTRKGDNAYGRYQVMGANIPSWTMEALGKSLSATEFLADKVAQDKTFNFKMTQLLEKYGNQNDAISAWFSGRPLSKAANLKDVTGTTGSAYVDKVNKALGGAQNIPQATSLGAQEGVKEGIKAAATANASATATQTASGSAGAQGGLGGGNAIGGLLSSALGGFGLGAQSQSPVVGVIGGALSGWSAGAALGSVGGPIGAVVGAAAGLLGGLFGRSQKKKQRQQNRDAARGKLAQNQRTIQEMYAIGEGRGFGDVTSSVYEFRDQTAELNELAMQAEDWDTFNKLQANFNKFFLIVERDFNSVFDGMIEAYSTGLGSDSPFVKAKSQMQDLREELKDFIADAKDFGQMQLEHNRAINPQQVQERYEEAQRAAQKMALSFLTGTNELTEMEEQMLYLDGVTSTLQQTLEELGMSADMAKDSIEKGLNLAIAKLQDAFRTDLIRSTNDLSGLGYLNDIMDAQQQYQTQLKDAAALGIDGSGALRILSLSIKDIVTNAGLGKDELDALSQAFPTLQFMFQGLKEKSMTLTEAKSQLQAAYDKEASGLEDLISRMKGSISAIKQFRESMKVDTTSPLSPFAKLQEAAKQFRETATKAATGDEDAINNLTGVSQNYLDLAREYYASSEGYMNIWVEVDKVLRETQEASEGTLSNAEKQLKALNDQLGGIINVNTSVLSVKEALDQYNAVNQQNTTMLIAQLQDIANIGKAAIQAAYVNSLNRMPGDGELGFWQDKVKSGESVDSVVGNITNSREAQINTLFKQINGYNPSADVVKQYYDSGKSITDIEAELVWNKWRSQLDAVYQRTLGRNSDDGGAVYWRSTGLSFDQIEKKIIEMNTPAATGFASGGYTGNMATDQIAGVVHGQEFVNHAEATARYRPQLEAMNNGTYDDGDDDTAALKSELRDLREQVSRLTEVVARGNEAVVSATNGTTQAIQRMEAGQALRRVKRS